jgi:TonB family protein
VIYSRWNFCNVIAACALGLCLRAPLAAAEKLTPAEAAKVEQSLESNPDDLQARTRLLSYYQNVNDDGQRKKRLGHLIWLVKHDPESALFVKEVTRLTPDDVPAALQGEKSALIAAWREQMKNRPDDEPVFEHALRNLNQIDYDTSVESLKGLRRMEPTNPRWVFMLATLYEGAVTKSDLAGKAQTDLADTKDLAVLGITAQDLYYMGKTGNAAPLAEYGESLLKRAHDMDPLSTRWLPANAAKTSILQEKDMWAYGKVPPMTVPPGVVRVAPAAEAARRLKHDQPVCTPVPTIPCPESRFTVRLEVLIGKDGRVRKVHALNGAVNTIPAAMDVARNWTYKPTVVNGKPVEVATQVDAIFDGVKPASAASGKAKSAAPKIAAAAAPPPAPPSPIIAPVPITKVEASFTPEARQAGYNGSVLVTLTVDEKGTPQNVKVAEAAPYGLSEKALDAVRQWKFKPAMQDGKPIASQARVRVQFKSQ